MHTIATSSTGMKLSRSCSIDRRSNAGLLGSGSVTAGA